MKGKELQSFLTGVVTFVVSAKENGVMVSYTYNPNIEALELYVRDNSGILETFYTNLILENPEEKLEDFMGMVIDKYYRS